VKILIVVMQHGNEIFGELVMEHFRETSIDTVLANPKAHEQGERYIDTDMNRSYKRSGQKGYEEVQADRICKLAKNYDFVFDIHTTTSDIDFVPIVASLNLRTRLALSLLPCKNVAYMNFDGIEHSLIGNISPSMSLEFNENFAKKDEAMEIVIGAVDGLMKENPGAHTKKSIYQIIGIIPEKHIIGEVERNFKFSTEHQYYPFLIGEKNYHGYKGFYAHSVTEIDIL